MKRVYLFIVLFINSSILFSQKVELGLTFGLTNYVGDVSPSLVLKETGATGGVFARYNVNNTWAFTAIFSQSRISGNDKNFDFNKTRNIVFRTDITDFSGIVEFNYFKYGAGVRDEHFTPYVFGGIGAAFFNPQGLYGTKWYDLKGVQTEGQTKGYNGICMTMPMGIGIKWMPNKNFSLEWKVAAFMAFTDYLDDVSNLYTDVNQLYADKGIVAASLADPTYTTDVNTFVNKKGLQRGNPDFDDWYFNSTVSVTYRIFKRLKCDRFY
ncbi:MAG: DUF6089 family protein [Bacteroidia bacterium]|nr:DUF6089 family protein [Bacteroidia bacterium]